MFIFAPRTSVYDAGDMGRSSWILLVLFGALVSASCGSGGGGGGGGNAGSGGGLPWTCTLWTDIGGTRMFCDCAYKYVPEHEQHTIVSHCDPTSFSVPSICCSYATPEYPECLCAPILCEPTDDGGCRCHDMIENGPGVTTSCTGTYCCLQATGPGANEFCHCGPTPCGAEQIAVDACGASVMGCAAPNQVSQNCAIAPP